MTQSNTPLTLEVTIPLAVPVPVTDASGKEAQRTSLTMKRPKTRHVKRLAVIVGPDLLKGIMSDDSSKKDDKNQVDAQALATGVFEALMSEAKLDGLTAIIADMCGETPALIDDTDPIDLWQIAIGFAGFFPALQSFTSTASERIAQLSSAGGPSK